MYPRLGTEFIPETDAGTFTINFRAPAGTRIELTTDMARQIEAIVRKVIPPDDLDMVFRISELLPAYPRFTRLTRPRIQVSFRSRSSPAIGIRPNTT